jgi:hypothetical protein
MLDRRASVCDRLTHRRPDRLTVTNRKPKPAQSRVRQWENGEPLAAAWFVCASWEAKRKYQTCDSDSRRASLRLDMQFQVLDDVISGKLVALGLRERAPLKEGPVTIPAHLFPRGGDETAVINWDMSALRSSGFVFVRSRSLQHLIAQRSRNIAGRLAPVRPRVRSPIKILVKSNLA